MGIDRVNTKDYSEGTLFPSSMSSSQHTPGPWHVQGFDAGDHEGRRVCAHVQFSPPSTKTVSVTIVQDTSKANAHLIAAAPELLEACKRLIAAMHQLDKGHHGDVAFAEAALAKAQPPSHE